MNLKPVTTCKCRFSFNNVVCAFAFEHCWFKYLCWLCCVCMDISHLYSVLSMRYVCSLMHQTHVHMQLWKYGLVCETKVENRPSCSTSHTTGVIFLYTHMYMYVYIHTYMYDHPTLSCICVIFLFHLHFMSTTGKCKTSSSQVQRSPILSLRL